VSVCKDKMHGIQHLFRQHALDKQPSSENWNSSHQYLNGRSISTHDSNSDLKVGSPWNQGIARKFSSQKSGSIL
jgi:hypothetical protein